LTRNGERIFPSIDKLPNTDLSHWKLGELGMLTYPEGEYTLTVNLTGLKDEIGNIGTGSQQISWTVNRSLLVGISNLTISPDLGYSQTDGITSGNSLQVAFDLSEEALQVAVYQSDISGETLLRKDNNVAAGNISIPVVLLSGGNTSIKVVATGTNEVSVATQKDLFVDQLPLSANWSLGSDQVYNQQIDSLTLRFSARLLTEADLLSTIQLKHNNEQVVISGLEIRKMSDTLFVLKGISKASALSGNYTMTINTESLSKYRSGISGLGLTSVSWTVKTPNRAPVANAGNDLVVTTPGFVSLDATASTDPDADSLSYLWIAPNGITMLDSTIANPKFTITSINNGQTYSFLLIVKDGSLYSTDVVQVKVQFAGQITYYRDEDGDGFGDDSQTSATAQEGYRN